MAEEKILTGLTELPNYGKGTFLDRINEINRIFGKFYHAQHRDDGGEA
jgi:hypothetical protein